MTDTIAVTNSLRFCTNLKLLMNKMQVLRVAAAFQTNSAAEATENGGFCCQGLAPTVTSHGFATRNPHKC